MASCGGLVNYTGLGWVLDRSELHEQDLVQKSGSYTSFCAPCRCRGSVTGVQSTRSLSGCVLALALKPAPCVSTVLYFRGKLKEHLPT